LGLALAQEGKPVRRGTRCPRPFPRPQLQPSFRFLPYQRARTLLGNACSERDSLMSQVASAYAEAIRNLQLDINNDSAQMLLDRASTAYEEARQMYSRHVDSHGCG